MAIALDLCAPFPQLQAALSIMVVMSTPPVMAAPGVNNGHKLEDSADANQGGGQEHPKNGNRKNGQFD
jgi:hypothetical protein